MKYTTRQLSEIMGVDIQKINQLLSNEGKQFKMTIGTRIYADDCFIKWHDSKMNLINEITFANEEWKQVKDFPLYLVSTHGRLISLASYFPKLINGFIDKDGYVRVTLKNKDKQFSTGLHRLILNTFQPNKRAKYLEVNHLNFEKQDNSLKNLEWTTRLENLEHQHKHLRAHHKLTPTMVTEIRNFYSEGITGKKLCEMYNVTWGCIWSIISNNSWKHIN